MSSYRLGLSGVRSAAGEDPPTVVVVAAGGYTLPLLERRDCRSARKKCGVVGCPNLDVNRSSSWVVYDGKVCQQHVRHVCSVERSRGRGGVIRLRDCCLERE